MTKKKEKKCIVVGCEGKARRGEYCITCNREIKEESANNALQQRVKIRKQKA